MMLPPWNKILRALPPFVVIRSNPDGGPGRSLDQVSLLLRWQKQDGEKHVKEVDAQFCLHECWPSFVGPWHYFWLSRLWRTKAICLCSHPYEPSHRFGFEFWSYMLSALSCNLFGLQSACNLSM
ncbi:hypothetical protein HU200_038465 [Digitaria exilis]|uniref:Uncharacterized protein n=1 Tax=Digitaria exilis TaxID=1010633 RepID=A0A835BCV2_9POAL|nr:hypothetical protein HU200_038465 [Digitaria exilis]